ncbi:MAG: hypothetical protein K2G29_04680 [Muribaculaceae bacterium]|nr:hypothetical protein [Muribaculaceae bacterium]
MRKVIFATAFVAMSGIALAYGMGAFSSQDNVAALQLDNAEVLAQNESGSSSSWTCWNASQYEGGSGFWRCGRPCKWIENQRGIDSTDRCYQ